MKRKKPLIIIGLAMACLGVFFLYGEVPGKFEPGKIIEKVVCRANALQSYALFLPSAYSPDKKWPIIYAFDPGARGSIPLEHFKAAAEKYGYIVVGSNNAKNGPWEPLYQAAKAMWSDSIERFSIDDYRMYAAGFSGGGRMASVFKFVINRPLAGIISCGAGLNSNLEPELLKPSLYYGIVGLADFNYRELMRLDNELETAGVNHYILVFDGFHQWPPEEYCSLAVEWMEINALKQGLRTNDETLVTNLYQQSLVRAQKLVHERNIFYAVSTYECAGKLFYGLVNTSDSISKAQQLKESKEYKEFCSAEQKRRQKESDFLDIFIRVMATLKNSLTEDIPRVDSLCRDLKIRNLQKDVEKNSGMVGLFDRSLAKRLLADLTVHAYEEGNAYLDKGDIKRAGILFEISAEAASNDPIMLYNIACAFSILKNKKKALVCLKKSLEKGFNRFELLKKDPNLDFLREEKEFKKILQKIN